MADEPAAQAERDPNFGRAGHPRDHLLLMEEGLGVAGRGGAGIREGIQMAGALPTSSL